MSLNAYYCSSLHYQSPCKGARCSLAAHRGSAVLQHSKAMLPGLNFSIPQH